MHYRARQDLGRITSHRLRVLRSGVGISRAFLADQIGVDPSLVSRWETGARVPTTPQVVALARYFGHTADEILGLTDLRIVADGQEDTANQAPGRSAAAG